MSCSVSVRPVGAVSIVDVTGRVTLGEGSSKMRDVIKKLALDGSKNILVNLHGVSYLDSSGLGELVSAYTSVTNAGGQIKLLHVQSIVKQLLQVTKLYTVFATFEDESLALQSFTPAVASA